MSEKITDLFQKHSIEPDRLIVTEEGIAYAAALKVKNPAINRVLRKLHKDRKKRR